MYLLTKRLSGEYGECRINSTDFLCHFLFNDEENALNFLKEELENHLESCTETVNFTRIQAWLPNDFEDTIIAYNEIDTIEDSKIIYEADNNRYLFKIWNDERDSFVLMLERICTTD